MLCRQLSSSERHGIIGVCPPEWQEYLIPPPGHLTCSPQKLAFLTVEDKRSSGVLFSAVCLQKPFLSQHIKNGLISPDECLLPKQMKMYTIR